MNKLLLIVATMFASMTLLGQTYEVSGVIKDTHGESLPGADVFVRSSNTGTATDLDGKYQLSLIEGEHELEVSFIGYRTIYKTVKVDQNLTLDFILEEDVASLQEVEIIGRRAKTYRNKISFSATKTGAILKDVPQSIEYVTKELMLDQAAVTVNDALKNVSSVASFGFYDMFSIRGTVAMPGKGRLLNGMRVRTGYSHQSLTPHLERVEVIKGPASALFGAANPGGVINMVTKKPLTEKRQSLSMGMGSFNSFRFTTDFTGPMSKDGTLLYRLNLGYLDTDGYRDLQFNRSIVVAPSFSFLPNEKTRVNVDMVYQNIDGRDDRGLALKEGDFYSVPLNHTLTGIDDFMKEREVSVTLSLQHKFTDWLTFNSIYMRSSYDQNSGEHKTLNDYDGNSSLNYIWQADGKGGFRNNKDLLAIRYSEGQSSHNNNNFSNYLNFKYNISDNIKTRTLIGYDYYTSEDEFSAGKTANPYLLKNGKSTKSFNPKKADDYVLDQNGNPKLNVAGVDINKDNAGGFRAMNDYVYSTNTSNPSLQKEHGLYFQTQWSFYDKVDLLIGLRQSWFIDYPDMYKEEKNFKQDRFLPRIGLVYKATKNINVYGSWINGFDVQRASYMNAKHGGPFDPETSSLYEVGVKSEWFNKRLEANIAFYDISREGKLISEGKNDEGITQYRQIGGEKSRGFEMDLFGRILSNWSISTSYSYNDSYITSGTKKDLEKFGKGKQMGNTPKHRFNIWSKYTINYGPLKGLGLGLGMNHSSETPAWAWKEKYNEVVMYPGYTVFNSAIYYNINKFQIQMNFNNMLDKRYYLGGFNWVRSFPGKPRNIMTTVSYKF